jgi:hypothetical protein
MGVDIVKTIECQKRTEMRCSVVLGIQGNIIDSILTLLMAVPIVWIFDETQLSIVVDMTVAVMDVPINFVFDFRQDEGSTLR